MARRDKSIRRPGITQQRKNIRLYEPQSCSNDSKVIFSFEQVQEESGFGFSELDKHDKSAVSEALFKRRNFSWNDLIQAGKYGLGTEKIPVRSVKASKPKFITEDAKDYLALRFNGKKPMLGYREGGVFYILYFDSKYSLYNHG
ncbi:hypothetical protein OMCYN_01722 [cyanobiont of Ornithocercus magnificus]|nr:hypothetical protein OMCYN_01722 [cyanobiont of Ornithocercus magnificus]